VLDLIRRSLEEDLGAGDLTTRAVVPEGARAVARIEQRASGVPAGLEVAEAVFMQVDPGLEWQALVVGSAWREPGVLATVAGDAAAILAAERVALNFLGRLAGVATTTARYVEAVRGTGVRILDTRKTTPGLRALEKEAVIAGGGTSHRSGLDDAVLVKENHAALAGGVGEAARLVGQADARHRPELHLLDLAGGVHHETVAEELEREGITHWARVVAIGRRRAVVGHGRACAGSGAVPQAVIAPAPAWPGRFPPASAGTSGRRRGRARGRWSGYRPNASPARG